MPAERFYIDAEFSGTLSLKGSEHHHLAHVMRIQAGEEVELVNGRGTLAKAKVIAVSKHDTTLAIFSTVQVPQSASYFTLAIPFMRPAKLELVVEKCTELGADAFWLYPAHHSEKREISSHQLERLTHIAISSMKQCGRLDLPMIKILIHFKDLFAAPSLFFGDIRPTAKKCPSSWEKGIFITGPEKGFSAEELGLLDQRATGIRLHRNILRAETAPIVATCLILRDL